MYIYSEDLRHLLTTHEVTWSKRDSYCEKQYATLPQPEEFFNFSKGVKWDD